MITAVTCRKGGSGVTTLTLSLATIIKSKQIKTVIVDLKNQQDYSKILNIKNKRCIDYLITGLGFNNSSGIELSDGIYDYNGIDVIQGTKTALQGYLYRHVNEVANLLEYLEEVYDLVIIDVKDDQLLDKLIDVGVNIFKIHVLDQNMLLTSLYQDVMEDSNLQGFLVVNKMDKRVYPPAKVYKEVFKGKKITFLPNSPNVAGIINETIRNKGQFPTKILNSEPKYYEGVVNIANELVGVNKDYNKEVGVGKMTNTDDFKNFLNDKMDGVSHKKKKGSGKGKKGLLSSLFGKR